MVNIADRILEYLCEHPEGADDDELAAALHLKQRQQANERCRKLAASGKLERCKIKGKYRNYYVLTAVSPDVRNPSPLITVAQGNNRAAIDELCRLWIEEIVTSRAGLIAIAMRQRAKFEGWLKFELAARIEAETDSIITVEKPNGDGLCRWDISFHHGGVTYNVELKTANTNWRCAGIENRGRPITKNIAGIIEDAKRLKTCTGAGIVAFVLFPAPSGDQWKSYVERIARQAECQISAETHCSRVSIMIGNHSCDVIVCCFGVSP